MLYLAIDGGRVLDRPRLQKILQTETLTEALQHLPKDLLHGEVPGAITTIESAMRHELFEYARKAMRRSPSAVTSALAYLVLRHGEMTSVYSIVHARMHGHDLALLHDALDPPQLEAAA